MNKKYKRDSFIFNKLTPDSAYWIGYLYGDGNCTCENKIRFCCASCDEELIYSFRSFIKCINKPIKRFLGKNGKPYSSFEIRDWEMHKALKKYSLCLCKKDRGLVHLSLLQDDVSRDFIRGLFDADGCFYYDGLHKNHLFAEITGYKPVLKSIKAVLTRHNVISETKNITKNGSIWRIRFPKDSCLKLIRFMYEGTPRYYLSRKYGLAKSYLDRLNETQEATVEKFCI